MSSPVLVVASLKFRDIVRYRQYQARFPEVFRGSGGTILAADEAPETLDGDGVDKVVIMRFESDEAARAFLSSPAYQEISEDRIAGAETTSWLVKGL